MTRDEVLAALSRAEVDYVKVQVESQTVWAFQEAEWKAKALRAAAEIIRESGWRPMNTAPRDGSDVPVLVKLGGKVEWRQLFASSGGEYWVNHGGGHLYRESECIAWFELPAPPAREVENG